MAPVPTISVKWFHDGVFRRFGLEVSETAGLYSSLIGKLQNLVPGFQKTLAWKDQDGDLIVFSTDAELREAINAAVRSTGELLRIYSVDRDAQGLPFVRQNSQAASTIGEETPRQDGGTDTPRQDGGADTPRQEGGAEHVGVVCDACDQGIRGVRYKCLNCHDYDLCGACEMKGTHREHSMVRITDPHDHSWRWCFMMNRRGGRGRCSRGRFGFGGRGHGPWWFHGGDFSHCGQKKSDGAAAAADPEGGEANPSEQFAQAGVNFLKEVGETVAAALGNLGIDVDVDVEHEGERQKVTPDKKKENQAEPMDDNTTAQKPAPEETVPKQTEGAQQDWTLLGDSPTSQPRVIPITIDDEEPPKSVPAPALQPNLYPNPIASEVPTTSISHPDPHVNQTLNQLLAMGFTNEGGWLTALVEQKKGDINATLNSLHPR